MELLTMQDEQAAVALPLELAWWDGDTFSRVHRVDAGGAGPRCGAQMPARAAESLTTGDWLPGPRCPACAGG